MFVKGDKVVVIKRVSDFLDKGDIAEVSNVNEDGIISFKFGEEFENGSVEGKGLMSFDEFSEHFEKLYKTEEVFNEILPEVTFDDIEDILEESDIFAQTVFDKCVIVACKLPNGHVVAEHYDFIDEDTYCEEYGVEVCLDKIRDKIQELETYATNIGMQRL